VKSLTEILKSSKAEKTKRGANINLLKQGWKFCSYYNQSIEFHELQCNRRGLEKEGYKILIEPAIFDGCVSNEHVSLYIRKPKNKL